MRKATMFTPDLFPPPTPENLQKYLGTGSTGSSTPAPKTAPANPVKTSSGPELKTQRVFDMMKVYLERGEGKKIVETVQGVFNFEILLKKGDPPPKTFIIDLKNGNGKVGEGKTDTADATFTMLDEDFDLMT